MKKLLIMLLMLPEQLWNRILFKYRRVKVGKRVVVNGYLRIFGQGSVSIGNGTRINSKLSADPVTTDGYTLLNTMENGKISIGQNVGISNSAIVAYHDITIEDNVMIGAGCMIYDTDFHSLDYQVRNGGMDKNFKYQSVTIENGAFIGARSIILKGSTIGKHSVIGAGSVVAGNIPSDEIWAGNPARFIRKITGV